MRPRAGRPRPPPPDRPAARAGGRPAGWRAPLARPGAARAARARRAGRRASSHRSPASARRVSAASTSGSAGSISSSRRSWAAACSCDPSSSSASCAARMRRERSSAAWPVSASAAPARSAWSSVKARARVARSSTRRLASGWAGDSPQGGRRGVERTARVSEPILPDGRHVEPHARAVGGRGRLVARDHLEHLHVAAGVAGGGVDGHERPGDAHRLDAFPEKLLERPDGVGGQRRGEPPRLQERKPRPPPRPSDGRAARGARPPRSASSSARSGAPWAERRASTWQSSVTAGSEPSARSAVARPRGPRGRCRPRRGARARWPRPAGRRRPPDSAARSSPRVRAARVRPPTRAGR